MGEDFYQHTQMKNFLAKFLINKYFSNLKEKVEKINFSNFLDVSAGNGYVTNYISNLNESEAFALDSNIKKVDSIKSKYPKINAIKGNLENISYEDDFFDFVVSTQTFEHLNDETVKIGLNELKRVSKEYCFITVPNEPYWKLKNLVRGKYIKNFGNTPEHIQSWNKKSFENLLSNHFKEVNVDSVYVWLMALCKK